MKMYRVCDLRFARVVLIQHSGAFTFSEVISNMFEIWKNPHNDNLSIFPIHRDGLKNPCKSRALTIVPTFDDFFPTKLRWHWANPL
jgi:hypothetical protein